MGKCQHFPCIAMRNPIKKGMNRHKIQEIEHTQVYVFCKKYVIPTKAKITSFFRSEKSVTSLRGVYVSRVR